MPSTQVPPMPFIPSLGVSGRVILEVYVLFAKSQRKETRPRCVIDLKEVLSIRIKQLGGGFKYLFVFTPKIGEDSHFDEHIFSIGLKPTRQWFGLLQPWFLVQWSSWSFSESSGYILELCRSVWPWRHHRGNGKTGWIVWTLEMDGAGDQGFRAGEN